MSRTFRKNYRDEKTDFDNKSRRSSFHKSDRKMRPYSKERGKFTITTSTGNENSYHIVDEVTETAKLVMHNANRSLKKGVRQELKKELIEELEEIEKTDIF